jgi:hypothetical protein
MDDVGQDGVFIALLDVVRRPVVGEFIPGLLPGHPLLNPFLAAAMLLPHGAGAFEGAGGIRDLLHPLVPDLGEPEFDRLSLGAGHALDEPQQGLGVGHVGEVTLAVGGWQFQSQPDTNVDRTAWVNTGNLTKGKKGAAGSFEAKEIAMFGAELAGAYGGMNSDYLARYKIYPRISNISVDLGRRLVVVDMAATTSELVPLLGPITLYGHGEAEARLSLAP